MCQAWVWTRTAFGEGSQGGYIVLNSLSQNPRLRPDAVNVNTAVAAVLQKGLHVEFPTADQISLSNLNQGTKLGDACPRCVQELAGKGVEDDVHALATSLPHNVTNKGLVTGVENAISRDVEVAHQELDLVFSADGTVHFSADHLGNLHSGQTNATTCAVNQDGLCICQHRGKP